jgi:hypothetical protein
MSIMLNTLNDDITINVIERYMKREGDYLLYRRVLNDGSMIDNSFSALIKNTKLNGYSRIYYPNGQMQSEVFYNDDVANGIVKIWYPDGKINSLMNVFNNKPYGLSQQWHPNGNLYSFGYCNENGKEHGIWFFLNDNNSSIIMSYFNNGISLYTSQIYL